MAVSLVGHSELYQRLAAMREEAIGPDHDPWDPYLTVGLAPQPLLTSIEVTVTNTCNLRCEHCAVGDQLTDHEERLIALEELYDRIDEVDTLLTFSVTGGEPAASQKVADEVTRAPLQYATARGSRTQGITNLTLALDRY